MFIYCGIKVLDWRCVGRAGVLLKRDTLIARRRGRGWARVVVNLRTLACKDCSFLSYQPSFSLHTYRSTWGGFHSFECWTESKAKGFLRSSTYECMDVYTPPSLHHKEAPFTEYFTLTYNRSHRAITTYGSVVYSRISLCRLLSTQPR